MAQDYAGGLSRSPRPNRIPRDGDRPNADMVERERGTRELDALDGRFGRYVDSGGNWATAWQAPAAGQAIGASPAFVAPGRVVKFRTGELALQSAPSDDPDVPTESTLISPGQWVVRYDGDEEAAIVVNDEAFRAEMRSEEQARAVEAAKEYPTEPASASELPPRSSGAGERQSAPTVTPEAPASVTHLMVDHFVKLVMSDNNRLRFDCERLVRERNEARAELSDAQVIIEGLKQGNARNYEERQRLEAELSDAYGHAKPIYAPSETPYNPPDPTPVDVPPELNPDPVEAVLAEAPPRVAGSKRKAN